MNAPALRCAGCGRRVLGSDPDVARCPAAGSGDGRDHVLVCEVESREVPFAHLGSTQPFVRYRDLLWTYRLARAHGLSDARWVDLVMTLDHEVARVDGHGFTVTPFAPRPALARALRLAEDAVWVKDETAQVGGSHKARHLFGLALLLEVREMAGLAEAGERAHRELAIASCGNAALAAAVVARAASRPLRVFIPTDADPPVVDRLHELGAHVEVCARRAGEPGDPCMRAFAHACAHGALPFCVQGNENGLTVEGGETLAFEMAELLAGAGITPSRLFVQTGGGALASALAAGFERAHAHALLPSVPRLHVVQTRGALPFRRAWERAISRLTCGDEALTRALPDAGGGLPRGLGDADSVAADALAAARFAQPRAADARAALMAHAREHRARYMWPWELAPRSVAHGILDDETYDWAALLEATLASGGWPLTVSEPRLLEAQQLAREAAGVTASATGAAGLAGLRELAQAKQIQPGEHVLVVLSGVERSEHNTEPDSTGANA